MWFAITNEAHEVVYGVGTTERSAWADASEWVENMNGLRAYPCTPGLVAHVRMAGGAVRAYKLKDGRLGQLAEMD